MLFVIVHLSDSTILHNGIIRVTATEVPIVNILWFILLKIARTSA